MKPYFFVVALIFVCFTIVGQDNAKCEKLLKKANNLIDRKKPKVSKALGVYDKIFEIDPNFAKAYYNRAWLYSNIDKDDLAIKDLNKCIELLPEDESEKMAQAYTNRGSSYIDLGEMDKALKDLNQAIEIDATVEQAYYNRARVYFFKNQIELACIDLNKALEEGMNDVLELERKCE